MTAILKESVTATLRPVGFRKRRSTWILSLAELSWLVNVQRGRFNSEHRADFAIEIGIYVPGVISAYTNRTCFDEPDDIMNCCIRKRLAGVPSERVWWELRTEDDADSVHRRFVCEISRSLQCLGLAFLRRFATRRAVADFLVDIDNNDSLLIMPPSAPIAMCFAGIIYALLCCQEESVAAIQKATASGEATPIGSHLNAVYSRLRASDFCIPASPKE